MDDRYDAADNVEAQFEPGSNDRVLSNKLGITDAQDMDDVELDLLKRLYDAVLGSVEADQRLAAIRAGLSDYEPMKGLVRRALHEADEYASPPYNRDVGVPDGYDWNSLTSRRGDDIEQAAELRAAHPHDAENHRPRRRSRARQCAVRERKFVMAHDRKITERMMHYRRKCLPANPHISPTFYCERRYAPTHVIWYASIPYNNQPVVRHVSSSLCHRHYLCCGNFTCFN